MTSSLNLKFGDLATVGSGYAFSSKSWIPQGIPVVKIRNVQDGFVDMSECSFVSEEVAEKAHKWWTREGDTLVALTGAGVGEIGRMHKGQEALVNQRVGLVKPKDPSESDYVYYLLRHNKQRVIELASGSAQPNLAPSSICEIECQVAEPKERILIGKTLASLDLKIQNNQQIASTLEQIAQTIFKSWFVDFDPVHAKARGEQPAGMDAETAALFPDSFEDSELGSIPTGWKEKTLGDICDLFDSKRVPLAKDVRASRPGPFPYYGATGALDTVDDFLFDGIYVLVAEDGTVMTAEGTPVIQYVWGKFWVSNHAHILKGRDSVSDEQLMLLLQRVKLEQYVTGAVQMKVSQGNLKSIPAIAAPGEINSCFSKLIDPLYAQIRTLKDQNQTLSAIRDSLLPRLISGELEIPAELLET